MKESILILLLARDVKANANSHPFYTDTEGDRNDSFKY